MEYKVEKIVSQRKRNGRKQYLVKWVGYPKYENNCLLELKTGNCKEFFKDFHERKHYLIIRKF